MFVLSLDLRSEEVSICLDESLLVVDSFSEQVCLVFAIESLAPILGRLVVSQINVLRLVWLDEGLVCTIFCARKTLL